MRTLFAVAALAACAFAILRPPPQQRILQLPAGVVELRSEMVVAGGTEVRGARAGTVLRLAPSFSGKAAIVAAGDNIRLTGFTIDGGRDALERRAGLPPYDTPFARFTRANGVFAEGVSRLTVENVGFRNVAGFAVLAAGTRATVIDHISVSDSGSRNPAGRNNATGGVLLEEGATDFRVTRSEFRNVRGNGVWTHSLYASPRNMHGLIRGNRFENIGRDAIQVGHAVDVRVEENSGAFIGFPQTGVDIEGGAIPVAIDTAGNVERSQYVRNSFHSVNGKCIDLDGFHDGEVRANSCINRGGKERFPLGHFGIVMNNSNPDMESRNTVVTENVIDGPLFGGIFVIGTGHTVSRNRLLNLNAARCDACYYLPGEPDMLRSGIYLAQGAERPSPARGNVIEDNEITGYRMKAWCVGRAPGIRVGANRVARNKCSDR